MIKKSIFIGFISSYGTTKPHKNWEKNCKMKRGGKTLRERALEGGNATSEWRSFGTENEKEKRNRGRGVGQRWRHSSFIYVYSLTPRTKGPKCVLYTCSTYATKVGFFKSLIYWLMSFKLIANYKFEKNDGKYNFFLVSKNYILV